MHDNKFVEEDHERVFLHERAYIEAERKQMEEEWLGWDIQQLESLQRKPALIEVEIHKKVEHEGH